MKLSLYCLFGKTPIYFFKPYLFYRKQKVNLNENCSEEATLQFGVHQDHSWDVVISCFFVIASNDLVHFL